jgi:hypothetical protein
MARVAALGSMVGFDRPAHAANGRECRQKNGKTLNGAVASVTARTPMAKSEGHGPTIVYSCGAKTIRPGITLE